MKLFLRLGFTVMALTIFFNAFAVTETKAQGVLNEILKRMETNRQTLQTLRSNITMAKYNTQLKENDLTEGTVIYLPGKNEREVYIRIDWLKPVQEQLAVVKDTYTIYRPRLKQVIIGKVDKAQNSAKANGAFAFLNMSKQQLKANYSFIYVGQEKVSNGTETVRLQLTPKNKGSYKLAEIWVDKDGMPIQTKVVESNDDTTTILLSDIKKNTTINASVFTIVYPKSIKPIKG